MKNKFIIVFLLMPFASFSQCATWIGGPVDSTLALQKVVEKYLEVPLERSIEKHHKADYEFVNQSCDCEFFFMTGKQKPKGKKKYVGVNEIVINGPVNKVKKMYMEYFYPLMKPCASSKQKTSLVSNGISAGFYIIPLHGIQIGQINLHK